MHDGSHGTSEDQVRPKPPTTLRGRRTREGLILAGREVLERHGWSGFTPEAVAQTAGVSWGTFSTCFESREDLPHNIGLGFPGWTGGVLQYINGYDGGLPGFVERAREFAGTYGGRFDRPALLLEKAERGQVFGDASRRRLDGVPGSQRELSPEPGARSPVPDRVPGRPSEADHGLVPFPITCGLL